MITGKPFQGLLLDKFELLGQVSEVKNKTRSRRSRIAENIAAVAEIVEENPGLSIPRRSLELGILKKSLHRILHKDLGLKAHKVQIINNVVSLLIWSMKIIQNSIEKSS